MTRADAWRKRPCVLAYWAWCDKARKAAGELPPTEQITSVVVRAYFSPPQSASRKKREALIGQWHRVKPDGDNVLKCLDALFDDDQKIPCMAVEKRWDIAERVEVEIEIREAQ